MGEIACEECNGNGYLSNIRFKQIDVCNRCHGSGKNRCPHESTKVSYKDIQQYVTCTECDDTWEVVG